MFMFRDCYSLFMSSGQILQAFSHRSKHATCPALSTILTFVQRTEPQSETEADISHVLYKASNFALNALKPFMIAKIRYKAGGAIYRS